MIYKLVYKNNCYRFWHGMAFINLNFTNFIHLLENLFQWFYNAILHTCKWQASSEFFNWKKWLLHQSFGKRWKQWKMELSDIELSSLSNNNHGVYMPNKFRELVIFTVSSIVARLIAQSTYRIWSSRNLYYSIIHGMVDYTNLIPNASTQSWMFSHYGVIVWKYLSVYHACLYINHHTKTTTVCYNPAFTTVLHACTTVHEAPMNAAALQDWHNQVA